MCSLKFFQQTDRVAGHTAAITGEAQVFFGGCLHIHLTHLQLQGRGDILAHLGNMVLQLGFLGDHRYVDISHPESCLFHLFPYDPK